MATVLMQELFITFDHDDSTLKTKVFVQLCVVMILVHGLVPLFEHIGNDPRKWRPLSV